MTRLVELVRLGSGLQVSDLQAALVCAVACAVLGWFAPRLIARLPEPEPPEDPQDPGETPDEHTDKTEKDAELVTGEGLQPQPEDQADRKAFARTLPPPPPKELYSDIAELFRTSGSSSARGPRSSAGSSGWCWAGRARWSTSCRWCRSGWCCWSSTGARRCCPRGSSTRRTCLLAVLIPLAALLDHDLDALYRAGFGWLVIGGWFWIFWWLLNAWGFGDVRLARVLGPALGFLGWEHMLMGLALMVIIGGLGGAVLAIANRSLRRRFPYGPFMLVGAAAAVVAGPWLARGLGY